MKATDGRERGSASEQQDAPGIPLSPRPLPVTPVPNLKQDFILGVKLGSLECIQEELYISPIITRSCWESTVLSGKPPWPTRRPLVKEGQH